MPKALRVVLLGSLLSVPFLGFSSAHAAIFTNTSGLGASPLCLDVRGGNTANSTPVQTFPCNATFAQVWNFQDFFILGIGSSASVGKCLNVSGAGTADGTPVQLFQCNGSVAQAWKYFGGQIINTNSGKCLDVGNGAAGTQATIRTCNESAGQSWVIR